MAAISALPAGCLLMAAGNASRFGENKLAACFDGQSLFTLALAAIPAEMFARVTVVSQYPALLEEASLAGTVRRVVDAWWANPDCIAAAAHNGKRGNPCLFPARFFPELCALEADRGGSSVIRRHEDALLLVEAGERELFDCDTKQALEILKGNA